MPEISLLQQTVLLGVVEEFTAPESYELLSRVPTRSFITPTFQWEIIRGSRAIAQPNVPNSEAHIVPQLGRSQGVASFIYLREKKHFTPTTEMWLREPGKIAGANAERAVLREIQDLNVRFDNFAEKALWDALSGSLVYETEFLSGAVDYGFTPSHKNADPATGWNTATPDEIVADITAWKRLVEVDGRVQATTAYASEKTLNNIFMSFATRGDASSNFSAAALLSDRMKDEFYSSGRLSGFMGLDWRNTNSVYDPQGTGYTDAPTNPGDQTPFLADDKLYLGNFTANTPIELAVGPTADFEAPRNYTGKFSKIWVEKDPSTRQFLLEWNIMPIVTRPDQLVYVANVNS